MRIGDVIETTRVVARVERSTFTFGSPKGSRFVLLYLGLQADKNPPIDLEKTLNALGWFRAPSTPAEPGPAA